MIKILIYLIIYDIFFLFQSNINLIAANKPRIYKIAIRTIEGRAAFKLDSTEVDKIKRHIQNHYQTSKIGKKLSLLSENQAEEIFEKMTRKEGYDSLKTLKLVDFALDCQTILIIENKKEPSLSVIQFNMKMDIFSKKGKIKFVDFREKIGYYFPARVDSALAIVDTLIYQYLEPEMKKVDLLMGAITIFAWKFLDCTIFKPKSRGKLPDAPIITDPLKY